MNGKDAAALPYYRPLNEFFQIFVSSTHAEIKAARKFVFGMAALERQIHTFDNVILFDRNS